MAIPGHLQRALDERVDLDAKREKLAAFMETDTFQSLDEAERDLLAWQATVMSNYSGILTRRLTNAGIDA